MQEEEAEAPTATWRRRSPEFYSGADPVYMSLPVCTYLPMNLLHIYKTATIVQNIAAKLYNFAALWNCHIMWPLVQYLHDLDSS